MGAEVSQHSLGLEEIQEAVEKEIFARLTADPCSKCGRGKNAEGVGATAIAKLMTDIRRLQLAKERTDHPEQTNNDLNPLSLVATIKKLPADHPSRKDMIQRLEGQVIALQEALRNLDAPEESQAAAVPLRQVR